MSDTNPILEPDYDFRTSCSKDEALQYLLGWIRGPIRENLLTDEERHTRYLLDDDELSVFDHLRASRESIEADLSNAGHERCENDKILAELEKCDSRINLAHHYKCLIDDELAKGDESELRIDHNATDNPKYPFITLVSLNQWAEEQNITIFAPQADQNEKKDASIKREFSPTKTGSLQTTLALLVEAFAKTGNTFHKEDGAPNISSISDKLLEAAVEEKIKMSKSTIVTAIKAAMKVKNENINSEL